MSRESLFNYFATEGKKLTHYVQSKIKSVNEMDAEDIVDEVLVNLLTFVGLNGQINNLPAYVTRSLQHKITDYYRTSGKTESIHTPIGNEDGLTLLDQLASAVNIEVATEQKEFMEHLLKALETLTPKQRDLFIATEIEGKSFKELSELWQEPIGTLLSRKSRTIKYLRETLADFNPHYKGDDL